MVSVKRNSPSADDNIVGAMHQTTVGCADVAGSGEVFDPKAEVRDQTGGDEVVTRSGVDEGDALDRLNVQAHVHHRRGGQDEGLVGAPGHGKNDVIGVRC